MEKAELIQKMRETYQTSGIDMYKHGEMVRDEYHKIMNQLEGHGQHYDLPPQISELYIRTKHLILPRRITDEYQLFHDCGKPFCLEIDENGRRHYPDHANVSANIWLQIDEPNAFIISELMRHDMDFHVTKGDDLASLWRFDLAPTLFFTALAEIYANASMFGGLDSDSFKIKKKRLLTSAKKCPFIKEQE